MTLLDIHTHETASSQAIINCSATDFLKENPQIFKPQSSYSVGIHPLDITPEDIAQQLAMLRIVSLNPQIVAIGEVGLDYRASVSQLDQNQVLKEVIALAHERNLPLIIHCVKEIDHLLAIQKACRPQTPWIWHGFRGKKEQMKQLINHGFYLSYGAYYNEEALRKTPTERLFLETDTATVSIQTLLTQAAQIKGVPTETLQAALEENSRKVFFKN
ncbi:MAG: hydrolase TatD [Bacteroidia bacterium]|nr:hydrolase TatD [Bacteroidia bacterium]